MCHLNFLLSPNYHLQFWHVAIFIILLLLLQFCTGTCESRNAGTRNGTRNGSKMRAARYHHAQGVFIHWTGLDSSKNLFSSVGQKLSILIYCLQSLLSIFPRVGRGQRSRAYLMSSSKMLFSQSWMIEEYYLLFSMLQQKAGVRCLR